MALLLLCSVTACARTSSSVTTPSPQTSAGAGRTPASAAIEVQVDNQNFSDMNIYLATGGTRWLVGQVTGLTKQTLTIPGSVRPADLRIRLLADPIGGQRSIATPTLFVPSGERIYWTIGSDPAMSTASAG